MSDRRASRTLEALADPSAWPDGGLGLERRQAILDGGRWEDTYARVYADAGLTVCRMNGEWKTYGSIEELVADGWTVS